jgi:hypothetical protein
MYLRYCEGKEGGGACLTRIAPTVASYRYPADPLSIDRSNLYLNLHIPNIYRNVSCLYSKKKKARIEGSNDEIWDEQRHCCSGISPASRVISLSQFPAQEVELHQQNIESIVSSLHLYFPYGSMNLTVSIVLSNNAQNSVSKHGDVIRSIYAGFWSLTMLC